MTGVLQWVFGLLGLCQAAAPLEYPDRKAVWLCRADGFCEVHMIPTDDKSTCATTAESSCQVRASVFVSWSVMQDQFFVTPYASTLACREQVKKARKDPDQSKPRCVTMTALAYHRWLFREADKKKWPR